MARMKAKATRILLVDDHPVVRRGISQLLQDAEGLVVCGEAEDTESALELVEQEEPDLVVVDLSLRESHGLDLIREIKRQFPAVKTLVLSMHATVEYVEKALRAGARGYVTKAQADEMIVEAIQKVQVGGLFIEESMNEEVLERLVDGPPRTMADQLTELSEREREVFLLMGEGKNTREIGEALGVNAKTVETFRRRIRAKLEVSSMTKLAHMAFEYSQARDSL